MPRGIYPRRRRKKYARRSSISIDRAHSGAFHSGDAVVDMSDKVERAHTLILDGMAKINEAQDLINSIPKRIPE